MKIAADISKDEIEDIDEEAKPIKKFKDKKVQLLTKWQSSP